jgi:hypothetical protein
VTAQSTNTLPYQTRFTRSESPPIQRVLTSIGKFATTSATGASGRPNEINARNPAKIAQENRVALGFSLQLRMGVRRPFGEPAQAVSISQAEGLHHNYAAGRMF